MIIWDSSILQPLQSAFELEDIACENYLEEGHYVALTTVYDSACDSACASASRSVVTFDSLKDLLLEMGFKKMIRASSPRMPHQADITLARICTSFGGSYWKFHYSVEGHQYRIEARLMKVNPNIRTATLASAESAFIGGNLSERRRRYCFQDITDELTPIFRRR